MASRAITGSGQPLPLSLIGQAIPRLSRHDLEALTERLIETLDLLDGDNDLELNGDELDGTGGEDDFCIHGANTGQYGGPGCPIADPDEAVDDVACDEDSDREPQDYADDEFSDPDARADHRRRIRRNRCAPEWSHLHISGRPAIVGHRLFREPNVPSERRLLRRKRGVPRYPRA